MRLLHHRVHRRYLVTLNGRTLHHPMDEPTIIAFWKGAKPKRGHHCAQNGDRLEFHRVR